MPLIENDYKHQILLKQLNRRLEAFKLCKLIYVYIFKII